MTEIQVPGETKPSYEQLMQQTERDIIAAPESSTTMAMKKPRVDQVKPLEKIVSENNNPAALPSDLKALTDQLLNGKPNVTSNHPSFEVTGNTDSSKTQRRSRTLAWPISAISTASSLPKAR